MAEAIHPDFPILKDIIKAEDEQTWETAWQKGITPWDFGEVQPSLREAVESDGLDLDLQLPKGGRGRALVPGCGGGYDLPYLAQTLGFDCLGLEVSETAIKKAKELIEDAKAKIPNISVSISDQDFFTFDPPEDELFDLVYDHTFFCAIPPSSRKAWGKQMTKLIKPGGYLITIVFPILPHVEHGPPYYIRTEHFEELLLLDGNFVKVIDKVPDRSSPSHVDRERLVVWRRS